MSLGIRDSIKLGSVVRAVKAKSVTVDSDSLTVTWVFGLTLTDTKTGLGLLGPMSGEKRVNKKMFGPQSGQPNAASSTLHGEEQIRPKSKIE